MNNNLLWRMLKGQVINNQYHLRNLIGAGGYGGVFLADEVIRDKLIRQVAIKLIISDNQNDGQLNEIIAATDWQHPNLIRCFYGGESSLNGANFLYLVMEVADFSLEKQLTEGVLSETEATLFVQDIAEALVYLHNQPQTVTHRDLKPGNVLRAGDKWKLSDFGLVKIIGAGSVSNTSKLFGTVQYVPPEAYDGEISPAWDVWSLGIIIVEALTGKPPFQWETEQQLQKQICEKEPDLSGLPKKFEPIVRGCLEKNRKNRWTVQQILKEIIGKNISYKSINPEAKTNPNFKPKCQLENVSLMYTLREYDDSTSSSLVISPDGQSLVGRSGDRIKVWQLSTGREIRTLTGHDGMVSSLAISPDGQILVSGSEEIKIWLLNTGREIRTLTGTGLIGISSLAISPDNRTLVSSSIDHKINIWQLFSGHKIRTLNGHCNTGHYGSVRSLAISPDGQILVSGSEEIKIWQLSTGEEIRTLTGHDDLVYSLAISPDGQTLVSGSKEIKIWQLSTGEEIRTLTGHTGGVYSLVVSPDGQTLVSGSEDKTIKIWQEV
jgi:serine/threonine protein kinase